MNVFENPDSTVITLRGGEQFHWGPAKVSTVTVHPGYFALADEKCGELPWNFRPREVDQVLGKSQGLPSMVQSQLDRLGRPATAAHGEVPVYKLSPAAVLAPQKHVQ